MRRIKKPDAAVLFYSLLLLIGVITGFSLALYFSLDGVRIVLAVIAAAVSALLAGYLIYGYVRLGIRFVREYRSRGRVFRLYALDRDMQTIAGSSLSAFYDIVFSLYCYVLTLAERSLFMLTISLIYLLFGIVKLYLIRNYHRIPSIRVKVCRILGVVFFVMGAAVAGIRRLIFLHEGGFTRKGLMIYVSIAYTIGVLVMTLQSSVKSYRARNLAWTALLRVKHVNVMYSIFTLSVAMMSAFSEDIESQRVTNMVVGAAISSLILGYAIFMFIRAHLLSRGVKKALE